MTQTLSRNVPVVPKQTALLFVDVQNFCANRKGTEYGKLPAPEFEERVGFYFREMEEKVVPNMQRLQKGCRSAGIGCIECKGWAADALVQVLHPIQERRAKFTPNEVEDILKDGTGRARKRAEQTMTEVRTAMQLIPAAK